jgi:hypothetical protein
LQIEPVVQHIVAKKFMLIHYLYTFENAEIYRACYYKPKLYVRSL